MVYSVWFDLILFLIVGQFGYYVGGPTTIPALSGCDAVNQHQSAASTVASG